jgi:hypothetical protein
MSVVVVIFLSNCLRWTTVSGLEISKIGCDANVNLINDNLATYGIHSNPGMR